MVTPGHNQADAHIQPDMDSTRWSVVLAAADEDSRIAQNALSALCEVYWYPVYSYIRRRVRTVDEAQDLTQGFFTRLLEKNYVADAQPERGRFRAFLLTAVKHFMRKEWQKAKAQKRGGDRLHFSLDFGAGEHRYALEPTDERTPEMLFDQQWAVTLVNNVLGQLRRELVAAGKEPQFDVLKAHLSGRAREATYGEAAQSLGISDGAVRVAAHRMRKRYRELLRAEIGQTVATPGEIEEEIRSLFATLSL